MFAHRASAPALTVYWLSKFHLCRWELFKNNPPSICIARCLFSLPLVVSHCTVHRALKPSPHPCNVLSHHPRATSSRTVSLILRCLTSSPPSHCRHRIIAIAMSSISSFPNCRLSRYRPSHRTCSSFSLSQYLAKSSSVKRIVDIKGNWSDSTVR